MPSESPRIAELRRRVDADPSSIAFAQLAEEYRRGGNYDAAEKICRTGLTRHPGYLSARVTLGRTLIELNKLEEAEQELNFVLKSAPDNLAAIRGMAEIHQRHGNLEAALDFYRRALPLARHDPEIEETVKKINRDLGTAKAAGKPSDASLKEAQDEFLAALNRLPQVAPKRPEGSSRDAAPVVAPLPTPPAEPVAPVGPPVDIESQAPPPKLAASDTSIDFDSLLKSLGAEDHQPPPMVEALLSEPAPAVPRPEPVLPELPAQVDADDPFADLERGLRAFDVPPSLAPDPDPSFGEAGPPSLAPDPDPSFGEVGPAAEAAPEVAAPEAAPALGYGEVSFDTAPAYGETPAAPAPAYGEVSFEDTTPAPTPEPIEVRTTIAMADKAAPVALAAPEYRTAPTAPSAPDAPEDSVDAGEQYILDELEAWLLAIKR